MLRPWENVQFMLYFEQPGAQNVQKTGRKFVPHHLENSRPEAPDRLSDSLNIHSNCPCGDTVRNCSCMTSDSALLYIP